MGQSQSPIILNNISFTYEAEKDLFRNVSLELPGGVVSLIGQNGTGKSTLLLLAGGRLLPQQGTIQILGTDTEKIVSEEERNKLVSFVYQNMEFESEETIGELLSIIYEMGYHKKKEPEFLHTLIEVLDLRNIRDKKTSAISKGEMQRAVIAFSLLYGSPIIMMDEPVFAMEDNRKAIVLAYLNEYAKQFGVSIYYSLHEIDLSLRYSDHVLIFTKMGQIRCGPTKEFLTRDNLELAYQVPINMLNLRENLYREHLLKDNIDDLKGFNTKIVG